MIHIATVHWEYDRWIDVQLSYFERNIDEPYRVYAWLDRGMMEHAPKFFYATDVPLKEHERKLTLLGDLMAHAADPDDMLVFIDGDAFPITPMVPFLREQLDSYPLVAVRRDENNGDPQPHPSFCATTARFWLELPGDWRRGYKWKNRQGSRVTDVGGNMLGLLEEKGLDWYPLLRTNKVNPHPLQFGVYGDLIYHHGGGFRKTAGGRVSWMPHRDALRKGSLRGWLAVRLPRRGRLGYLRRRIDPVRRYRRELAEQLAVINDRVFELIKGDDQFYRQLTEPGRGGELAELQMPSLDGAPKGEVPATGGDRAKR
jgi:hypothetical protein